MRKEEKNENLITRPPIVVVLGHVDHGKTSLLDYIRKTHVAEKEAGKITQHIGAYEIDFQGHKITFIDTPGHEAFSQIRSRGAKVADIAILVVAADEGVKPQTIESIQYIKEEGIPFVVAINKIDKPEANVEKVKQELLKAGVLLEKMGGDVPFQTVSARTGEGVNELLDIVLLLAEMQGLKANPQAPASGVVIELHLDRQRGNTATLIITDGTLHSGDSIYTSHAQGKVKILEDFQGRVIEEATFSSPVRVVGFNQLPLIGEKFWVGSERKESAPISSVPETGEVKKIYSSLGDRNAPLTIPLIIKTDVSSSAEALAKVIDHLGKKNHWFFLVLRSKIGDISENDLKIANPKGTLIIGFRVKQRPETTNILLANKRLIIEEGEVIYELEEKIQKAVERNFVVKSEETILGKLEVLAIFHPVKKKQLIGGKVLEGKVMNKASFHLQREGKDIALGKVLNLQKERKDVKEVSAKEECGLLVDCAEEIEKGDILEFFQKI